jgi:hypothetical protein
LSATLAFAAERQVVGRMTAARTLLLSAVVGVAVGGCDSLYLIQGSVHVAPSAVGKARLPAVLCSGPGGPLESSFVHSHPTWTSAKDNAEPGVATIFCAEPHGEETFPLDEEILYGKLRRAYEYAWLVPVPAAESLCASTKEVAVKVDTAALYRLKLATQTSTHRGDSSWPCGQKPAPEAPMTFVITFDPEHKTWVVDDEGHWIERPTIRLE